MAGINVRVLINGLLERLHKVMSMGKHVLATKMKVSASSSTKASEPFA